MQSLGDPFLPPASRGVGTHSPVSAKCERRQKHGSHQREDALSLPLSLSLGVERRMMWKQYGVLWKYL